MTSESANGIAWGSWNTKATILVYQGLCLSLNIDPSTLVDMSAFETHVELRRRLRRLSTAWTKPEYFPSHDREVPFSKLLQHEVSYAELSAWCATGAPPLGFISQAFAQVGHALVYERQRRWKEEQGRYTLEEAAELIERETGERAADIQRKLMDAARGGRIAMYEPGKLARYDYGPEAAKVVRPFHEEAYGEDLNRWLTENEPRLRFLFPTSTKASSPQERESREVKREDLTREYEHKWPSIADDLKRSSSNGLGAAAMVPMRRGYWYEEKALEWASARGKLSTQASPMDALFPATTARRIRGR